MLCICGVGLCNGPSIPHCIDYTVYAVQCAVLVFCPGRAFCLDFCSDTQLVGSECGKNIMRASIHPASY